MNMITKGVISLPRKEYAALLGLKKIKEFRPTLMQKRALLRAETSFKQKKTLSYDEFVRKLGSTN